MQAGPEGVYMRRRDAIVLPLAVLAGTAVQRVGTSWAAGVELVTEDFMLPAGEPGMQVLLRNKRPAHLSAFRPERTLLFVHGLTYASSTTFDLPLGGQSWMEFIAERGFDVWCLDLPGYGGSTKPSGMARPPGESPPLVRRDATYAAISAAADFVRARHGVEKLVVMAWSAGTTLMGRYAAENPGLVHRVVLYAPVWLRQGSGPAPPTAAYRSVTREAAQRDWLASAPAVKRDTLLPPGWFTQFAQANWLTDPDGARETPPVLRVPNGPMADLRDNLTSNTPFFDPAAITVPTLLIGAEWDTVAPPYMAAALFPLLTNSPGKLLVGLAEGTHSIFLERNRGALFKAVQGFLEAP
jgi:pimeloyl-ACP methyl ester carboxylesterase